MEQNNRPLISICIPTYNRCNVLKSTLHEFCKNSEFDNSVELVICDNASTDKTREICSEFIKKNNNIKYYSNIKNIKDENFIKVLNYENGEYVKLLNDWTYIDDKSLSYMKFKIKENLNSKTPIFFTTDTIYTRKKAEVIVCSNLDDYVQSISTYVTSNLCFGAWREQWDLVENKYRYSSLKLMQVDWSYQIVNKFGGCILYDKKTINISPVLVGAKGGYNWFKIHLDNYYKIMMPYVCDGLISHSTLEEDKKYLLNHFKYELVQAIFHVYPDEVHFDYAGAFSLLFSYYKDKPYFYLRIIVSFFLSIKIVLINILKKYLPTNFYKKTKKIYHTLM